MKTTLLFFSFFMLYGCQHHMGGGNGGADSSVTIDRETQCIYKNVPSSLGSTITQDDGKNYTCTEDADLGGEKRAPYWRKIVF